MKSSKNLENCIAIGKKAERRQIDLRFRKKSQGSVSKKTNVVKLQRANGGYLGTQRRRRTSRPTKRSGELEASIEPEISEWDNPKILLSKSIALESQPSELKHLSSWRKRNQ